MNLAPIAILAVAAAVVFGGGKKKKRNGKRPPRQDDEPDRGELSVEEAIEQALREMRPGDTIDDATNRAYWLAFADCPEVLDPDDPDQDECIQRWLELRYAIDTAVSEGAKMPEGECDPLDPSTWPEGTICVDTSGGWRALPEDEAESCKSTIFVTGRWGESPSREVWVCLSDGAIENLRDMALRGPINVEMDVEGDQFVRMNVDQGAARLKVDRLDIVLEAPNPYGAAGVRAIYLALAAKKENPDVYLRVQLHKGPAPRGVPKYMVGRYKDNLWQDEVWLPVDEGWDQNVEDVLSFAEETY